MNINKLCRNHSKLYTVYTYREMQTPFPPNRNLTHIRVFRDRAQVFPLSPILSAGSIWGATRYISRSNPQNFHTLRAFQRHYCFPHEFTHICYPKCAAFVSCVTFCFAFYCRAACLFLIYDALSNL